VLIYSRKRIFSPKELANRAALLAARNRKRANRAARPKLTPAELAAQARAARILILEAQEERTRDLEFRQRGRYAYRGW
jgi:hypothetical protein